MSTSGPVAAQTVSGEASTSGTQGATIAEKAQVAASGLPDPTTLFARAPPPPPPLPESGNIGGAASGTQSQLTQKLAETQDSHQLAARKIVGVLRDHLNQIVDLAEKARHDLSDIVGQRTIITHGTTRTGKSTVVPWEAMRWLEEHCAIRCTKTGQVICSQQRRKVTISLAERCEGGTETWGRLWLDTMCPKT